MEVRIGKSKYFVKSDKYCFILAEEKRRGAKSNKQGEKYLEEIWYYRNMEDLLKELALLKIRLSDAKDIIELGKDIQSTKKLIEDALKSRHWVFDKNAKKERKGD